MTTIGAATAASGDAIARAASRLGPAGVNGNPRRETRHG